MLLWEFIIIFSRTFAALIDGNTRKLFWNPILLVSRLILLEKNCYSGFIFQSVSESLFYAPKTIKADVNSMF